MSRTLLCLATLLVSASLPITARAAETVVLFDGKNLDGWTAKGPAEKSNWTVGLASLDPNDPKKLVVAPAAGVTGEMINAGAHGLDVYYNRKFADCTISLEVMVPQGSNSGIYVMGEYEIQVLDSFGREKVGPGDMGGLYAAAPPKVNASKAPGQWQQYVIEFKAPRFEGDKKVSNARFVKITLNGQVIHENVDMLQQTPGGVTGHEVAEGPLMFQGNHGEVAYRNIRITVPAK